MNLSKLLNYRKDYSIVDLQMKYSDVFKVLNNIIQKHNIIVNTNYICKLADKYACDIRDIISGFEIFKF